MKKAFNWLNEHNIEFDFQDFKKEPVDEETISNWLTQVSWDQLINKRGTTWRKLSDEDKENIDNEKATQLILQNNSLIKRPVLLVNQIIYLGFKPEQYQKIFN